MKYLLWAVLLILQNASFTMTSRARNSGSDWYHAFAAVFSNGFWILNMIFLFDPTRGLLAGAETLASKSVFVVIYIVCTVFGSVVMGRFLRRHFETGKRRVGYYEGKAESYAKESAQARNRARPRAGWEEEIVTRRAREVI